MNTALVTKAEKSVFIEGHLWFDKSGGNTYFSNRVWVDGKVAFQMGLEYGYDMQYMNRALQELKDRGYTDTARAYELRDEQGINLYHVAIYGKKNELFKEMN